MEESTTKVFLDTTSRLPGNQTDVTILEDEVEYLSIIVWSMGGVILISLLILLARIILAPNKRLRDIDYIPNEYRAAPGLYQIGQDGPACVPPSSPIRRDTTGLIRATDFIHWDTLPPQYTPRMEPNNIQNTNPVQEMTQRQSGNSEHVTSTETSQLANRMVPLARIMSTDPTGSRATVNGFIIRPPSYRDVTGVSSQLPSVIVTRPQPRYQLFSL